MAPPFDLSLDRPFQLSEFLACFLNAIFDRIIALIIHFYDFNDVNIQQITSQNDQ